MTDTSSNQTRDALADLDRDLDAAELAVATEIRDGEIVLSGMVGSDEDVQAAVDLAQPYADELGLRVNPGLEVEVVGPEDAFEDDDRAAQGFGDLNAIRADGDDTVRIDAGNDDDERAGSDESAGYDGELEAEDVISLDANFTDDPGTTNVIDVVENGATYFPPTDPPTARVDDNDGFAILNGFSNSSTDVIDADATLPEDDTLRVLTDDELADYVRRELREDAITTDLPIHVTARGSTVTLRGEVDTLEDAENAEAVAYEVPAVVEVREELTIRGIAESDPPDRL
jgi:osmotically-inducible protein OsmY